MKVSEMIAKLQQMIAFDPSVAEIKVVAEGCDCYGDALDVRESDFYGRCLLVSRESPK